LATAAQLTSGQVDWFFDEECFKAQWEKGILGGADFGQCVKESVPANPICVGKCILSSGADWKSDELWQCVGQCVTEGMPNSCPTSCETCVANGGGESCVKSDCDGCSKACTSCIKGMGGKACAKLCKSGASKLGFFETDDSDTDDSEESDMMLHDIKVVEKGLRGN